MDRRRPPGEARPEGCGCERLHRDPPGDQRQVRAREGLRRERRHLELQPEERGAVARRLRHGREVPEPRLRHRPEAVDLRAEVTRADAAEVAPKAHRSEGAIDAPLPHHRHHQSHWHRAAGAVETDAMDTSERERATAEAGRVLAQAHAEAEAIRREALVTADGIRRIALEDARSLNLGGSEPAPQPKAATVTLPELLARVKRLEKKTRRQRDRIERLENVLLGLAPGLSGRRDKRKKKR